MTAIAFGIGAGITLVIGVVLAMQELAGSDPPAEPPDPILAGQGARDRLFRPAPWVKGRQIATEVAAPAYNRPLELQLIPDHEILPPPREVRGVNNEAVIQ
jgi:hypothetical protein